MEATINNATALLEEVIVNGKKGKDNLYAWFLGEQNLIENTIFDLLEESHLSACVCFQHEKEESTAGWSCPVHGHCL